ncbi:hypothetical protein GCM10027280_61100 [Micromonospora polyrhachis]
MKGRASDQATWRRGHGRAPGKATAVGAASGQLPFILGGQPAVPKAIAHGGYVLTGEPDTYGNPDEMPVVCPDLT